MDEAKIQEILAAERKEKLRYQEKYEDIASFGAKINGLATMVMAVFTVLCATGGYDFESRIQRLLGGYRAFRFFRSNLRFCG